MGDRSRLREGRPVFYHPTPAEETAQGPGPWAARVVDANADGTADLMVFPPSIPVALPAAVADPLVTEADLAVFTDPPNAAEMALLRTLVNSLKADVNTLTTLVNALRGESAGLRKTSIVAGGLAGQFAYEGRPEL